MLTKKDFKCIAKWWRQVYLMRWDITHSKGMVQEMIWLSKSNPNFNHLKFIKAVYLGE